MSQLGTRKTPRTREGVVVSNAPEKSAVVSVRRRFKHARYHKFIQRDQKYLVHDEKNQCGVGDRVQIAETRPISRRKHWKLTTILERAIQDPLADGLIDDLEAASRRAAEPQEARRAAELSGSDVEDKAPEA